MMTLKSELALRQLEKGKLEAVQKELQELHQTSRQSMTDVRKIVNQLKYRTVLEEMDAVQEMMSLAGIDLSLTTFGEFDSLSPVIQSSVTMVLRELCTNVIKHSKASCCQIKLSHDDKIVLEMADNGCGFSQLTGRELSSIKDRLTLVKGQVAIISPAKPTQIRITIEEEVES